MSTIERKSRVPFDRFVEAAGFSKTRLAQQVAEKAGEQACAAIAEMTVTVDGRKFTLSGARDLEPQGDGSVIVVWDYPLPDEDIADVDA